MEPQAASRPHRWCARVKGRVGRPSWTHRSRSRPSSPGKDGLREEHILHAQTSPDDSKLAFSQHDKAPAELSTLAKQERMCSAVRTLLECIGEDPDREGLISTPSRFSNALLFFTQGYECSAEQVVNEALFREEYHGMVLVKDIDICSLCEHHLIPFIGKIHIAYVPDGVVVGLSKLPRIAEMLSRRLQIQERLTREVADTIMHALRPQGVAVLMESTHLCMMMRGVERTGIVTMTECFRGSFEDNAALRSQFLGLLGARPTSHT